MQAKKQQLELDMEQLTDSKSGKEYIKPIYCHPIYLTYITDSMDVHLSELREMVVNREAWRAAIHGVTKSQTRLSDRTELNWTDAQYIMRNAGLGEAQAGVKIAEGNIQ